MVWRKSRRLFALKTKGVESQQMTIKAADGQFLYGPAGAPLRDRIWRGGNRRGGARRHWAFPQLKHAICHLLRLDPCGSENPKAHPELLIWAPNIIFITLGSWMFYRLSNSTLLRKFGGAFSENSPSLWLA